MLSDVERFWKKAWRSVGEDAPKEPPQAWAFGDTPELANDLLALVLVGRKTATADALWRFEFDEEPLPEPGDLSIVLDGFGWPHAVIETTEVRVMPLHEIDEQFAFDEGEGDRSRDYWLSAHERYFSRTLPEIGREFDPAMPLVLERFRLRYP